MTQSLKCQRSHPLLRVPYAMSRQGCASSSASSSPHSLSHDGNSGKVSKRMTMCCHGQRGPCHHLLCFLCKQETFYLVSLSLVSVPSFSPMQLSPSLPTPLTYPPLSSDGATAPLQGHGLQSGTKCNVGPNNPVSWDTDVTGD